MKIRRKNMSEITHLAERVNVVHKEANNVLAVVWKDKREVSLLSTIHNPSVVGSVSRDPHTRQPTIKPECVTDYNINMRLVDKSDAMISSIDCARKALKWYKKLFFRLLDITMLNIIHRIKTGKKCKLEKFVVEVIRQLLS